MVIVILALICSLVIAWRWRVMGATWYEVAIGACIPLPIVAVYIVLKAVEAS